MRSFKRFSVASWPAVPLFLLLGTVIAGTAQAQLVSQITSNGAVCGGDLTTYGNCTAGEISISQVTGTVYDNPWQGDQACVRGETVTALETTVEYSINTQARYDLLLWIGEQEGTDPRAPAAGDPAKSCLVASLPGPFPGGTGNNVFVDLETTDQCADINGGAAATAETRVFTNLSVECQDNDNNGFADIQLLSTWSQNQNQSCGLGNGQSFPTNGANSKCDYQILNTTLEIVEPASLTIVKNTIGGDDTFDFATTGGLTGTAITTSGGTGSFKYTGLRPIPDLSIVETLLPNSVWDATDITCTGATNNGTFTDSATFPTIQGIVISEGEDVVCTVSNTKLASLTVVKNTSGANGAFQFVGNNGIGQFPLDTGVVNTAQITFPNLQPGTDYSLTETIPADWNLAAASCSSGGETADLDTGVVTGITLPAGGDVTCTFNNAKPGLSTITKTSVGGLGTFDFTITNASPGTFSLTTTGSPSGGSSAPTGITLAAGQYVITENDPSAGGWTLTDIQCTEDGTQDSIIDIPNRQITLNVQDGETIACDVTNTKDGTVIVEKQTLPAGDPADFVFSGDLAGTLSDGEILTLSDNFGAAVTSDETVTDGWDLTDITCTGGTSASTIAIGGTDSFNPLDSDISVLPAPGETITCVYTNTKLAQLTIVKHITATGPLVQDFSFTSDILGSETFTLSPVDPGTDDQRVISGMDPGIYGVGEDPPGAFGWALTGASCGDGSPVTAIDLSPGEELTCTFTNSPLGSATIIKNTVGGDDTFAFVGDDPILGFNLDTTITTGTASADFTNVLAAGTYDVVETPLPAGWMLTAVDCVDDATDNSSGDLGTATATINVDLAETVTCTFENTADAQLVIAKQTIPATDPTSFGFRSLITGQVWDSNGTIDTTLSNGTSDSLTSQPGPQFVRETPVSGYAITDIECIGDTNSFIEFLPSGADTFQTGDTSVEAILAAGEVVTCTYTNTKQGSLTIVKETVGDEGSFTFNHDVPNVGSPFVINTAVDDTNLLSTTLLPGSYTVSEVVPTNWDLSNIACSGANDSSITIGAAGGFDPGDTGVTVGLASGEDIVCTFTNTVITKQVTLQKAWVGGVEFDTAALTASGVNGPQTATSTASGGDQTDTSNTAVLTARAGETIDLAEVLGAGNVGDYATDFNCSTTVNAPTYTSGDNDATLLVDEADTNITCTFTNTVNTAQIGLFKAWVGGVALDTAALTAAGTLGTEMATSTATGGDETDIASVAILTALVGETVTLSEVLGVGNAGDYATSFACADAANVPVYTDGDTSATLLIDATDSAITCIYTNTINTAEVTLQKAWVGGVALDTAALTVTGANGAPSATSTANGGDETDTTNVAVLTARVGETITLGEVLGGQGDYSTGISCVNATNQPVSLNDTTATLLIDEADTDITCTFTNTINTAAITLQKSWIGGVAGDTSLLNLSGVLGSSMATSTSNGGDETDTTNVAVLTGLVGETVTFSETLGGTGLYNTSFVCSGATNSPSYTPGATTASLLIDAADANVTCTFTNSVEVSGLTLQKSWVGAVAGDTALLSISGSDAPIQATSTAIGGDQTDLVNVAVQPSALAGQTITMTETLGGTGVYATGFVCLGATNTPTYTPGATSATLLIDEGDTSITCTFTNTIETARVELQKSWVRAVANDTAALDITGTNGSSPAATSVAAGGDQLDTVNTAVFTALVGDTITLSEVLGGTGDYDSDFSCSSVNAPTYTPGATSATLLIDATDSAITCTFSNTINTVELTLQKAWVDGVIDDTAALTASGINGPVMATSTATGGDQTDTTNTAVLTAVVGETVTLTELLGGIGDYTAGFSCTSVNAPTYTPGEFSATLEISPQDAPITCTYTNTRVDPAINLAKTVNGPATLEADGTYTVVYTVTASNTGGYGTYDVVDTFSPGAGITLTGGTPPVAVYQAGTENTQTGTLGAYSNFVTGEGLAGGLNERWLVTANFTIDPALLDPASSSCEPSTPVVNTGFYNYVEGSMTDVDLTDNATCTGLEDPIINLAKTVSSGATLEADGTYTVVYTITASNTGGPGAYDITDTLSPGTGITVVSDATYPGLVYAGGETQTGVIATPPLANAGTWVTAEGLVANATESWTVTASFMVDPALLDPATSSCDPATPVVNTGFYNYVEGSVTDVDLTDNAACTGLDDPGINLAKTVASGPTLEADGTYTVVYTITATNTGGVGVYDLVDTFSPGTGITLNTADAVYLAGSEDSQTGTTAAYPNFVTDEGLGEGMDESWTVTANFTVDPATLDPATSSCDPATPVINTGFYNYVEGSVTDTDLTDNETCTGLDSPGINLAKTVNGPATMEIDGTYTVVYTITATNTGGIGVYDLVDTFSPGAGITLNTADAVYMAGSEDSQTGTTAAYPNFVIDEGLDEGMDESWTVTANFAVDPALVDPATSSCDPTAPVINTGFYNYVEGSVTDVDLTDNETCTGLLEPQINLAKSSTAAVSVGEDLWEVVYTITATNAGSGPGVYDVIDTLMPGDGITPVIDASYPAVVYAGGETQSGTVSAPPLANGGTWVSLEALGTGQSERWTITARFTVDVDTLITTPSNADCVLDDGEQGTGYMNYVEGSETDEDLSDNETCVPYTLPMVGVPTLSTWAMLLMILLMTGVAGLYFRPEQMRRNS